MDKPVDLLLEARQMWKEVGDITSKKSYRPPLPIVCYVCEKRPEEERFHCPKCREIEQRQKRQKELLNQFSDAYIIPVATSEGYHVLKGSEGYGLEDTLIKGDSFNEHKQLDVRIDIVGTVKPKRIVPKALVLPFAHYREIKIDSRKLQWLLDLNAPRESLKNLIRDFEDNVFPNAVPDSLEMFVCHLKSYTPVSLDTMLS
jgi:predicted nucleic acid-binding Zn ribbon protein